MMLVVWIASVTTTVEIGKLGRKESAQKALQFLWPREALGEPVFDSIGASC